MLSLILTFIMQTSAPEYSMLFARQVVERLNGEGAISVAIESNNENAFNYAVCTVRNRLDRGWHPSRVLEPFYAPDVPVSDVGYTFKAYNILNRLTNFECGQVYYMYSNQDIVYLGIPQSRIVHSFQSNQRNNFGLNYVNP